MNSNSKLRAVEPNEPLTASELARNAIKDHKKKHPWRTPWVKQSHGKPLPVDAILRDSEPNLVGKK